MVLRRVLLPATLAAAVGVPVMMNSGGLDSVKRGVSSFWTSDMSEQMEKSKPNMSEIHRLARSGLPSGKNQPGATPIEGMPVSELSEVLRFDVTRQWVMQRWPRVTTQLANLDLDGLRVPVVTGTEKDGLAGSLTYYFSKDSIVQRITFHGYTGDETKLVDLVVNKCGLQPEPTLGRGLYLAKWGGKPRSALRVRHASVVRVDSPFSHLEVELELNRPDFDYRLSKAFSDSLEEERRAGKW